MFIGMVYARCGNPKCAAREVSVWVKGFDHVEPHRKPMYCPFCRKEMAAYATEDIDLYHRNRLKDAIGAVNAALYMRQTGELGAPPNVILLDELPESWDAKRTEVRDARKGL